MRLIIYFIEANIIVMSKNSKSILTVSPMFLLFIVFLILKLTDTIDWSWWWVTSPLWGPIAFMIALSIIVGIFVFISWLFVILIDLVL